MGVEEEPKKSAEEPKDEFSFLQETIKREPVSRNVIFRRIMLISALGLIFGAFACVGFYALRPWASSHFQAKADKVTIPEDEEELVEEQQSEGEVTAEPQLSADSYRELVGYVYAIAQEAEECVVSVRPSGGEDALSSAANNTGNEVAGVIVADNNLELLIAAHNSVCADASGFTVRFADNSSYPATLKKQDRTIGLAIFAVDRTQIESSTWESIKVATLGNSNVVVRGSTAIALGNMFGYAGGVSIGMISSTKYDMELADGNYSVLGTDIALASGGTGILFNLDGEVTGLIMPGVWPETENSLANAFAISDLKAIIERLSNGESVPYIGIHGVTVDDATAEAQGIPKGLYVQQVDADSPAMNAGIQSGDIVTQIGRTKITSVLVYQKALQEADTGSTLRISGQRRGAEGYVDIDYTVTVGSRE